MAGIKLLFIKNNDDIKNMIFSKISEDTKLSRFWNKKISNLETYMPGEQPQDKGYIKLNTNANPYPPSPQVIKAIIKAADEKLKLYPDPSCQKLCEVMAEYHDLQKVFESIKDDIIN